MLLLGIAAADQARRDQWDWAGILAGVASLFDPSALLLVMLLLISALRSDVATRQYAKFAVLPTLFGLIAAVILTHDVPPFTLIAGIALVPLLIAGAFSWPRLHTKWAEHPYVMILIAWSVLDTLVRVVIFKQPPSPILLPGLVLLAAWLPLRRLLLIVNTATLILMFSTTPAIYNTNFSLRPSVQAVFQPAKPVSIPYSPDLTLIGVAVQPSVQAGTPLMLRLDWQVGTPPTDPLTIQIDFLNRGGQSAASLADRIDTTYWERGRLSTQHTVVMPSLPPGVLDVYVTVSYRAARLGGYKAARVIVPLVSHPTNQPQIATFTGGALLQPTFEVQPDQLIVTLRWQSSRALDGDYKFFLHVEDAAHTIPAQVDAEPLNGGYPTSLWQPGDLIEDAIVISLAKVPPGDYTLQFGMYNDSARLSFRECHDQPHDSLALAAIRVAADRTITVLPLECVHQ